MTMVRMGKAKHHCELLRRQLPPPLQLLTRTFSLDEQRGVLHLKLKVLVKSRSRMLKGKVVGVSEALLLKY